MQKNILIIGYGDIAKRLVKILDTKSINIYAISRNDSNNPNINKFNWDWLSDKKIDLKAKNFDSAGRFGRGISKQAFYLLPKIRETDSHLYTHRACCREWREAHPELCFAALQDGVPMSENKKTQAGYLQRFELLSARMGKRTVIQLMSQIDADPLSSGVSRDDILDAMVCGYVARLDAAMLSMLPEGGVERNEKGDAMAICFPSPNV